MSRRRATFDVDDVAARIGVPVAAWPGNCYGIALGMVEAGLVPGGVAVYGAFWGPVAPGSRFDHAGRRAYGCVRHGWVRVGDRVVDPTRYVFEGAAPSVYEGPADDAYDEGANRLRAHFLRPPPAFVAPQASDPWSRPVALDLPAATRAAVTALLGDARGVTRGRLFWLANLPLPLLGPHAAPLYRAIVAAGEGVALPWDNRCAVLGVPNAS